jgi:hypothetical protein
MITHPGANSTTADFWADFTARSRDVPSLDTTTPLVHAELRRLAERWQAADDLVHRATLAGDACGAAAAQDAKWDAAAAHFEVGRDLAHLGLLLVRYMLEHEPAALQRYLVEALRPELEAIARMSLEGKRL